MSETCQWNHPRKDGEGAAKGTPRTSRKRHSLARWILAALVVACGTIAAYCFLGQKETVVPSEEGEASVEEKVKKRGRIPEVDPVKVAECVAKVRQINERADPAVLRGWIDDFDEAKRLAAKERKLILVDFSGSDWCGWCMKLDKEVFATEEFLSKAPKKFILLMIDSPRDKTRLSEKSAKQNPGLRQRYGIRGYPTVLILDSRGEVLYKTGYRAGGPIAYLKHLEDALGNR